MHLAAHTSKTYFLMLFAFKNRPLRIYSKGETYGNHVPYPAFNIVFTFDTANVLLTVQLEASDADGDNLIYSAVIFENGLEIFSVSDLTVNSLSDIPVFVGAEYNAIISVNDCISTTSISSQAVLYE